MSAYYNENDPKAAAWLRELIRRGHIADGIVDERSITEIKPHELSDFTQCHFFAGIGGWSYALRLAGWPDNRPVGTGSCPCQPFSDAGLGRGIADERHLWPAFFRLITECRALGQQWAFTIFGEQVASKSALGWLDGVFADLEKAGYACGAIDLCAAGVGAPHIRQRLFWVADSDGGNPCEKRQQRGGQQRQQSKNGGACGLADSGHEPTRRTATSGEAQTGRSFCKSSGGGDAFGLGNSDSAGSLARGQTASTDGHGSPALANGGTCGLEHTKSDGRIERRPESSGRGVISGRRPWDSFDILHCTDGKARRIEPGTFPLAHGFPCRVGLLRGYGNAINAEAAAVFIESYLETISQLT